MQKVAMGVGVIGGLLLLLGFLFSSVFSLISGIALSVALVTYFGKRLRRGSQLLLIALVIIGTLTIFFAYSLYYFEKHGCAPEVNCHSAQNS